ncbi:MAG: lysostaphin resistance A-like protein [Phycisphaeraceae bacterium]
MRRQSFAPKRRPIRVALAWTVIFACTVAIMAMQAKMSSLPPPVPSDTTPGMDMVLFSRMVVGFELVLGQQEADLLAQLEMQADASPFQTTDLMRVAVVIGELYDSDTAKNRLDELTGTQLAPSLEPAANFQTDHQLLRRIYSDEAYVPSSAEANDLILRHGWFGELAATYNLASSDTAYTAARSVASRTIWLIMTFAVLVILAFMAGFVLFITAIILLAMEKIKPKFQPGTLTHNSAYLELVAVFLVAFIALQMLAVWLTPIVGFDLMLPMLGLMVLPVFWPMLCGIRFSQYRKDMGLTAPKGIHREVAAGVVGYLAGLPIVFVGGVLTVLAAMITGMDSEHPAGREILTGGNYEIFVLVLATVVWAPIVEEIVFRAAFYRHLRKLPGWVTWIAATVVTSFIFAAIHPQGIVGIPILMSIAFVLAGLRQWRGSLVAPIAAHALHNGTIITFTITLMYL